MPKTDAKTGRFTKGNGGGPGRGKKAPLKPAGPSIADDMERGYSTAETPGEPPGVTAARKLAREDYPKFLALYARFRGDGPVSEVAAAATLTVPEVAAAASAGPREVRVDELIDQLLAEWA